jgi:uncharacterized membrane protein
MFKDSRTLLISGVILLILDSLYLKVIGKTYAEQVATVQRTVMNVKFSSAIVCYILLIFGLYYFILKDKKSVFDAFLLGIVIYGVYDTTTHAIFKKWSTALAALDTLWGGVLLALTTMITYNFI